MSLVELLKEKQPATHPQRLAIFAYYREHLEEKGSTFAKADLKEYFATAKLPTPSKYDREWNNAVREGWIHDAGASSYLTQAGEEKMVAGFGGKAKPRGRSVAKKAKRTSKPGTK